MTPAPLALFALAAALPAFAQPPAMKGVPLGGTEADIQHALPGIHCADTDPSRRWAAGERACIGKTTYATVPATVFYALWSGRVEVARASFSPSAYASVIEALRARYGAETSADVHDVTTRAGQVYRNLLAKWTLPDGVELVAEKYAGSITQSTVTLSPADYLERAQRRRAAQTPQRAEDL